MSRRRKILLLGLCGLIAVGVVCFFCFREKEPSYNGRTLSEWLEIHNPSSWITGKTAESARAEEAEAAVRHIGTNAVPTLLRWVAAEDGSWRVHCATMFYKHPRWLPVTQGRRLLWNTGADRKHALAVDGFTILGTNATPAIPPLKILLRSQNLLVANTATNVLFEIAPQVLFNSVPAGAN